MLKDWGEKSVFCLVFLFVCLFDWPSESLEGKQVEIKAMEDKV